jgi:hypothetical protein
LVAQSSPRAATKQKNDITAETFDNSKNPVARFEGLGSIFRERRENKNLDKREKPLDRINRINRKATSAEGEFSLCTRAEQISRLWEVIFRSCKSCNPVQKDFDFLCALCALCVSAVNG